MMNVVKNVYMRDKMIIPSQKIYTVYVDYVRQVIPFIGPVLINYDW